MPRGEPRVRAGDGSKNVVGSRVRERRDSRGWSQARLIARLAFVTGGAWNPAVQEVTHIETGRRTVLDIEVFALALALECSAAWLLTGTGRAEEPGEVPVQGAPNGGAQQRFQPGVPSAAKD